MKKEFTAVFQITKKIIFEVNYYTLGNNNNAHFSTSASEFNQPKTDFRSCGQAQEKLLPVSSMAGRFFKKWDSKHLSDLTEDEYAEMIADLEKLKEKYNFLYKELDESKKPYNPHFYFSDLREFSKQTPKKSA